MSSFIRSKSAGITLTSLLALTLAGCAQNAILELYVEVPPMGTMIDGRRVGGVRVTVGRGEMDPVGPQTRSRVYGLDGRDGIVAVAIDRRAEVSDTISVDVTYCADTTEVASCDVELGVEHLTIRNPFYTGVATCFVRELPEGAFALAAEQTVGTCEVGGCFGNDLTNRNFCSSGTDASSHFCRTTLNGDYCDALRGSLTSRLLR